MRAQDRKWDNFNSIINKIHFQKKVRTKSKTRREKTRDMKKIGQIKISDRMKNKGILKE